MIQDDVTVGRSYADEPVDKAWSLTQPAAGDGAGFTAVSDRPVFRESVFANRALVAPRAIRSPLDMAAAANIAGGAYASLKQKHLTRRGRRKAASSAAMDLLQASHIQARTL